jgi:CheY-like chemotaxis protein
LVVDNNRDAAAGFAMVLRFAGCEAAFITDPRDALAEIIRLKPHVAFLNIGMPYLDGFQLARLLRAEYQEPLKLIAVTGPGEAQDPAAWRKAGFDAQVVMPVDPALVQSMIETLLIEGSASGNPKLPPVGITATA